MHSPLNITLHRETDDDPEYGFREETREESILMSIAQLQLLATELSALRSAQGIERQALERVCDYVLHDPLYDVSTRDVFRSTLQLIRQRTI